MAVDRKRNADLAERAEALALAVGEIQRHDRDALALDVAPDVDLGPVQQRMDAHVHAGRQVGGEMVPQPGRLVAEIPGAVAPARAENALLGAGRSEERRGGKDCASTCRYRWSPAH